MNGSPRVSVVLPFRDAAATLDAALDSLAAQTLQDFECLLIDDSSRDDSADTAHRRAAADPRFRVLAGGAGLVAALNQGIAAARAPLVARMDADDLCLPRRLERQCAALDDDPSLALVGCLVEAFPAGAVRDGMRRYVEWLNGLVTSDAIRAAMFVESPLAHPSVLARRATLVAAGGYRAFDGPEDYDLWLRLLLAGQRLAKVPEVLLRWRESPGRLSRVDPRCDRRRFFATKLLHLPAALPPATPLQIWGAGPTGRMWARALLARGYPVRRFVDVAPRRWDQRVLGISVARPDDPEPGHGFALIAVGTPDGRASIESWLVQHGFSACRDYFAVA